MHSPVGYNDVRAALKADGAELFVNSVDVFDTKLLATHATTRRLFAAASPWADARGWGSCAARVHLRTPPPKICEKMSAPADVGIDRAML
jgi:hypothetical protein